MKNLTSDFYCSKCNVTFNRWHDFARHVNTVHLDPSKIPFICSTCDKAFARRDNFLRHMKTVHSALERFNCEECKKKFVRKDHFVRHLRCTHPEKFCAANDIADTNELYFECWKCGLQCRRKDDLKNHIHTVHGTEEFECDNCGGKFKYKKNLLVHFRRCPYPKSKVKKRICILCGNSFVRKATILKHYREEHRVTFEEENLKFPNIREFINWKNDMEKSTNSKFVICNLHKRQRKQISITQYICHRSGPQIIKTDRCRRIKFIGSKKLNAICPAEIKLHLNNSDSTCVASFRKTHLGHDLTSEEELDHLCLSKRRKTYPRNKTNGVSRCSNTNTSADESLLINNDVCTFAECDINSNCEIRGSYTASNDDPGNIETFASQYPESILYYKKLHEPSDTRFPSLRSSDMVLIFMNSEQKSLLQKHGDGVVAVDWTYGTNPYHFNLHTILILDYDNEAVPVVFAISNRSDFEVFNIFLTCIKEQINNLQPTTLMTGLQKNYYNHWKTVIGAPQYHLFCTLHVRKLWKINIKKIKNKFTQKRINEILHELSAEANAIEFNRKLNILINDNDGDLQEFLSYFRSEFVDCTPSWAYCYWPVTGISINMQLESFHHSLKHVYNRCRRKKITMYAGLTMLVQFLRDKLKSIIKTHGKMTFKLKGLRRAHDQYVAFATKNRNRIKIEEIENGWLIQSFQVSEDEDMEKMYIVRRLQDTCPAEASDDYRECDLTCPECRVCAHLYYCTCAESAIRNNMCKHIHAVASKVNITSSRSVSIVDGTTVEENPLTSEFVFVNASTDKSFIVPKLENIESGSDDGVRECKKKLFRKLSNIVTFVSAEDEPEKLKALEILLETTTSAMSSVVSPSE